MKIRLQSEQSDDLKTRLYLELARRSLPATPFYPFLGALVVSATDYGEGHPFVILAVLGLLGLSTILRLRVCKMAPVKVPEQREAWYRDFAAISLFQACSWTVFCLAGLAMSPGDRLASNFLLLLCTTGIASAVPTSLGLDGRLASAFLVVLLAPLIPVITAEGTRQAYGLAVLLLFFAAYLVLSSRRMGIDHTQISSQAILLELRADQLKDEVVERERAEEQALASRRHFSDLVKLAPVGILELDSAGSIRSANPVGQALLEIAGVEAAEGVRGTSLWSNLGLASAPNGVLEGELVFSLGSGSDRRWVAVSQVRAVSDDAAAGSVVVLADVTEQHRAEEEIRNARDAAEDASRMKSEFLANMSHELRTPMNGIVGIADVLTEVDEPEAQTEFVRLLQESTMKLLAVVDRILEFAAIDREIDVTNEPFGLDAVLDEATAKSRRLAREKGLELRVDRDPRIPVLLVGDGVALDRVVRNLVENAVSFTDQGRVTVSVALEADDDSGRQSLSFQVADTGVGIPVSRHAAVFVPFEQVDGSTTRSHEGVGLGLAIASRLVQRMGGELQFSSEEGRGTTFSWTVSFESTDISRLEMDAPLADSAQRSLERAG